MPKGTIGKRLIRIKVIHMKIKKIVMMTVLIISIISIITVFAADSGLFEKVDYSIKIGNASAEPK